MIRASKQYPARSARARTHSRARSLADARARSRSGNRGQLESMAPDPNGKLQTHAIAIPRPVPIDLRDRMDAVSESVEREVSSAELSTASPALLGFNQFRSALPTVTVDADLRIGRSQSRALDATDRSRCLKHGI